MWETYQAYCDEFNSRGWEPLSEEIWQHNYAPKKEDPDQQELKPLYVASKKSKTVKPTLLNHSNNARKVLQRALESAYQMGRSDTLREIANV